MQFLINGGWLVLPLLLLSVITCAIITQKFMVLRKKTMFSSGLKQYWLNRLTQGPLSKQEQLALNKRTIFEQLMASLEPSSFNCRDFMQQSLASKARSIIYDLEKNMSFLGTIAAIAPLIGLLGTLIGLMDVFAILIETSNGSVAPFGAGIAKALVTTALGLSIAIIALCFHRYFVRRIEQAVVSLESFANDTLGVCFSKAVRYQ